MKRNYLILLITCVLFAGSLTAIFATANERNFQLRGYANPTQEENLPFRIPRFGVNADLTQYNPEELRANLEQMRAIHVKWVRQYVRWDEIEPTQGNFDWSAWDTIAEAFRERPDLQLVAVLFNTPSWARNPVADDITAPPANPLEFASFAAEFARHYGDVVDVYQIWDQPNLGEAWGNTDPRAIDYVAILSESSTTIRSNDATATILAAALAPTTETSGRNISDILYLEQLYALNAHQFADGFAAKAYGFNSSPLDRHVSEDTLNFSRVVALRDVMNNNGDSSTPLWISEFGWNSLPPDWSGEPSIWGQVTQADQSLYTRQALDRAEREWAWLGGMLAFTWQPNIAENHPLWGFSLLDSDNQPTQLYQTLQGYQYPTVATNGVYFATNPHTEYHGVWTFSELGADIGWVQDSQLSFNFQGSDIALLLRQDNYEAYLYPTVDGYPANALPIAADGRPFINLKSDQLLPEVEIVAVSQNLANTNHTLQVIADRGWDRWALIGYAVSDGDLAAPYNRQITLAIISAGISLLSIFITAFQIDWQPINSRLSVIWKRLGNVGQIAIGAITSIALMIGMFITWNDSTPALFRREPVQFGLAVLSAGIIYLQPGLILTIISGFALFLIVYQRIELGLMLTLFFAPFFLFPVELYRFAFPMSELVILITTAAALLRGLATWGKWKKEGIDFSFTNTIKQLSPLDWLMVAWLILGVISITWAQYRSEAITELRTLIIEPLLFYVILRALKPSTKTLLQLVDTLLIAGFVVAIYGLILYVQGDGTITAEGGVERLASVYGSPNNVSLLLGRCIPFLLAFMLTPLDKYHRIAAGVLFVFASITVTLTLSAGALFIGVPVSVIVVLFLLGGKRHRQAIVAVLVIGVIVGLLATQSARFSRLLDLNEGTNFFRIRVWQSAAQIIEDHPITGLGLDQFLYAFQGRYMLPDAWQEPHLSHPHNFILDWWTRLGIFGILLFAVMQAMFWKYGHLLHSSNRKKTLEFALIVGTLGSMANLLAHGIVDNSVFVSDLAFIFVLLIAIIASLRTSELLTGKLE